jgi:hypothetical protein
MVIIIFPYPTYIFILFHVQYIILNVPFFLFIIGVQLPLDEEPAVSKGPDYHTLVELMAVGLGIIYIDDDFIKHCSAPLESLMVAVLLTDNIPGMSYKTFYSYSHYIHCPFLMNYYVLYLCSILVEKSERKWIYFQERAVALLPKIKENRVACKKTSSVQSNKEVSTMRQVLMEDRIELGQKWSVLENNGALHSHDCDSEIEVFAGEDSD